MFRPARGGASDLGHMVDPPAARAVAGKSRLRGTTGSGAAGQASRGGQYGRESASEGVAGGQSTAIVLDPGQAQTVDKAIGPHQGKADPRLPSEEGSTPDAHGTGMVDTHR